jgi:hypothetical protein
MHGQNSSGNDQFTDVVETLRPKTVKTWNKPEPGSIKVNVDASFIFSDGQASVGVVARNEKGEILFLLQGLCLVATRWKKLNFMPSQMVFLLQLVGSRV